MDRAEDCRVDSSPAATEELEQKSIKEKKKKEKFEAGCRAERGIWVLGHESELLTGTLCAVFLCWEWKKLSMEVEKGLSTC